MVLIVIAGTIFTLVVILFVHLIGRSSNKTQIPHSRTKEAYVNNLSNHYGNSGLQLYAAIGDALDQKSAWRKTMDIIFEVLDNNPHLLLEYLIECYSIDELLDALGEYEGQPEKFSKGTKF